MIPIALTGFFTSFSLILAIGAQNAFVLRQGLLRRHVVVVCSLCAISDAILITVGVLGFGTLIGTAPLLPTIMRFVGAAFLIAYGALRFRAAWRGNSGLNASESSSHLWPTVLTCLALTWLNPHVYLDTLALIGAISTRYEPGSERLVFGSSAVLASFVFFFSLGFGARLLAPLMRQPVTWRVLDVLIGVVMWIIAISLVLG